MPSSPGRQPRAASRNAIPCRRFPVPTRTRNLGRRFGSAQNVATCRAAPCTVVRQAGRVETRCDCPKYSPRSTRPDGRSLGPVVFHRHGHACRVRHPAESRHPRLSSSLYLQRRVSEVPCCSRPAQAAQDAAIQPFESGPPSVGGPSFRHLIGKVFALPTERDWPGATTALLPPTRRQLLLSIWVSFHSAHRRQPGGTLSNSRPDTSHDPLHFRTVCFTFVRRTAALLSRLPTPARGPSTPAKPCRNATDRTERPACAIALAPFATARPSSDGVPDDAV